MFLITYHYSEVAFIIFSFQGTTKKNEKFTKLPYYVLFKSYGFNSPERH